MSVLPACMMSLCDIPAVYRGQKRVSTTVLVLGTKLGSFVA